MDHVCNEKCRRSSIPRSSRHIEAHNDPPREENMSSWLDRQFSSHNVQLAAAAVASGAVVAGAIYSYQAIRREEGLEKLKASIPQLDEKHHAELVRNEHV